MTTTVWELGQRPTTRQHAADVLAGLAGWINRITRSL
jgi:hypothetical protein